MKKFATRSSAVAEKLREASCLCSTILRAQSTARTIKFCSVVFGVMSSRLPVINKINIKNFHGSLTTVVA